MKHVAIVGTVGVSACYGGVGYFVFDNVLTGNTMMPKYKLYL